MLRLPLAFVVLALAQPALALDCRTATNQQDLNECAGREFEAADAKLNKIYGQIVQRLAHPATPDAKTLLMGAQRAWVAFRDAECSFQTSVSEGGTMHPMEMLGCRRQLTEKRIAELTAYLSCKAEDGDCPTAPAN